MKPLYKTTIVVWTEYDASTTELSYLGEEAMSGDAYCSKQNTERIEDPTAQRNG